MKLHLLDGRLWTFWKFNSEAVLHCLQQLGCPVTLAPGDPPTGRFEQSMSTNSLVMFRDLNSTAHRLMSGSSHPSR